MVSGSFEQARAQVLALLGLAGPSRALGQDEVDRLEAAVLAGGMPWLLEVASAQDRALVDALIALYERARRDGLGREEYAVLLADLARRWGALGADDAPILAVWVYSAVSAPATLLGTTQTLGAPPVVDVTPYLRYRSALQDNTRPAHRAPHGFVARVDWSGWVAELMPPHGWNCLCRFDYIGWRLARELGYVGDFPVGRGGLEAFRAAGGTDDGFPRAAFVVDAPAA